MGETVQYLWRQRTLEVIPCSNATALAFQLYRKVPHNPQEVGEEPRVVAFQGTKRGRMERRERPFQRIQERGRATESDECDRESTWI